MYLAPFILTPITLLLGESIPKLLALTNPHAFALLAARPLRFLATILAPLLYAETVLSRLLRRLAGVPADAESVFLSRDDLARLMRRRPGDASQPHHDAILPAEQLMISRIFRFSQAEARKAMVPLVGVDAVPEETSLAAAIETVRREGFSRIPVFRRRITDIVGVVHVFDLLQAPDLSRPVSDVMRPVSYFPESMPLDEALVAMQRTGENLAVIVDEYGGAAGILTLEDLVEEIVGDIEDEYDLGEELAKVVSPRVLSVVGARAGHGTQRTLRPQAPRGGRVCYHRRAGGRTARAYSQARRKINRGRVDDHRHAQRRTRGARSNVDAGTSDPLPNFSSGDDRKANS